ncbi:MAG: hypothetical protein OEW64_13560 [Gammaproteobacteria bacterium]|nr:hypothetical protein [Gammaproteobacteria bacterium]MDH5305110.1 hypothetical protein [Gammaproteobacteria bacterium]MDH5321777.1 hypothetical protein [Gammaproteobacteria bacterium]
MRFAEVFLRLGSGLVAWMLLYAWVLWLAALHALACGPDGDEMHRLLLGMAPLAVAAVFLLRVTCPLQEVHAILRWLALPLLLLIPFCLRSIWGVVRAVHLNSVAACSEMAPPVWQQLWSPLQLAILLFIAYMLVRSLRVKRFDTN